jgi:hypothetical protein
MDLIQVIKKVEIAILGEKKKKDPLKKSQKSNS